MRKLTIVFYAGKPDIVVTVPNNSCSPVQYALTKVADPNMVLGIKNASGKWID